MEEGLNSLNSQYSHGYAHANIVQLTSSQPASSRRITSDADHRARKFRTCNKSAAFRTSQCAPILDVTACKKSAANFGRYSDQPTCASSTVCLNKIFDVHRVHTPNPWLRPHLSSQRWRPNERPVHPFSHYTILFG